MADIEQNNIRPGQQEIIDEYVDRKFREVLDPLYADFEKWKHSELTPFELNKRLHDALDRNQEIIDLVEGTSKDILLFFIEEEKRLKNGYHSAKGGE